MKKLITTLGVVGIAAASISAYAYSGEKLVKYAQISIEQARAIALKAYPGKITDEELEKERGGSGLRYSFDIESRISDKVEGRSERKDQQESTKGVYEDEHESRESEHVLVHEVGVDAKTGVVLENALEGKNPD